MMEASVNPGMCRCCASEGAFKDIKSTYHWMGEEEIYADMLRECFDIILNASEQGQDGGICEVCITQLRNAINFKKQVLHTEEQFQKHLQNKTLFRPHIVKVEVEAEDDSDDNMGSGDDAFSGAEFEVPIKTEIEEPKPKKRAAKASATTTRASAKKAKSDNGETSSKHEQENMATTTTIKIELELEETVAPQEEHVKVKPEKVPRPRIKRLLHKHLHNLKIILESTNATMILKHGDKGYLCCYCSEAFQEPMNLKIHTLTEHQNAEKFYGNIKAKGPARFLVKLDITNLKCMLCSTNIDSLGDLLVHLTEKHEKNFYTDIQNQIFPFKFNTKQLKCCQCTNDAIFATFSALHEHMHKHYRYFICNECDAGFVNHDTLSSHKVIHTKGTFACRYCSVVFDNVFKRRNHEMGSHKKPGKLNKCHFCNEGFKDYITKELHLSTVHGVAPRKHICTACDRSFPSNSFLSAHVRRFHLMEKTHKCSECDRAFFRESHLNKHKLSHTGVKNFICEVCSKHYASKSTLYRHMRIHNNDRRYKCTICDQAFVQKSSLTWHMKGKHADACST